MMQWLLRGDATSRVCFTGLESKKISVDVNYKSLNKVTPIGGPGGGNWDPDPELERKQVDTQAW